MKLKLITVPNPLLREKSLPVTKLDTKTVQYLKDLGETLREKMDPPGVGLSAVQTGHLIRAFYTYLPPIFDLDSMSDDQPAPELKLFLNPHIIDASKTMTYGSDPDSPALEGCLSVPALYGPVARHQSITVKYLSYKTQDTRNKNNDAGIKEFARAAGPRLRESSTHNSDPESLGLVEKTDVFSNFYARVIQHEYDHLEGILFTDYTKKDHQTLYFDQGKQFVEIEKPEELLRW